jgi:hypothetical protein
MKSLDQVEPRMAITNLPAAITQAGSYYFVKNLTGIPGTNGITIIADNVVLDLNGFALIGVPGATNGISSVGLRQAITVQNGNIQGWPGVAVDSSSATGAQLEHLEVQANGSALIAGNRSRIQNCIAQGNLNSGITTGISSQLKDCISSGNGFWNHVRHGQQSQRLRGVRQRGHRHRHPARLRGVQMLLLRKRLKWILSGIGNDDQRLFSIF